MATVIAMTNHKGGVAKTTSVSAIGYVLANEGNKVLLVDLDTQANLTYSYIAPEEAVQMRCFYDAVKDRKNLPQVQIRENLYIVPNGLELAMNLDQLHFAKRREYILYDLLKPIQDDYDIILIDCPPSLDILTLNAMVVADRVVVPMTTSQLSYLGVKMILAWLESQRDLNPNLKVNDIFFTQYDSREKLTRAVESQVRAEFDGTVMETVIHRNVSVSEPVSTLQSIFEYKPDCQGAKDYYALAAELINRINSDASEE